VKALVIGGGGREHALCWALAQDPDIRLYSVPGNPGIAGLATTVYASDYLALADRFRPDLTIIGPEAPLVAGVVDQFRAAGYPVIGPTMKAAQIESSKSFTKALMDEAGIPTARYTTSDSVSHARESLQAFGLPVVLKADGLAAGKGVIVAHTPGQAEFGIHSLFNLSNRIVIEGARALPLEPSQDHKTIFDNDQGPNTGGMGAYSDSRILSEAMRDQVLDTVIEPALHHMRSHGYPFTGFLYAGLMLTDDGPKVLEFNARLGDPETQALMLRLRGGLVPALDAAARGDLGSAQIEWSPDPAVCVVLAAHGYPGNVRTGDPITGLDRVERSTVFHSGTQTDGVVLKTAAGRVLGVTASAPTLQEARETVYDDVRKIHFEGMQYRSDIAGKGLKRW
jgi:phosphoribosylamine--glycine ligase